MGLALPSPIESPMACGDGLPFGGFASAFSHKQLDEFEADGPFARRPSALAALGVGSYSELRRRSSAMQVEQVLGVRPGRSHSNRSAGAGNLDPLVDLEELARSLSEEIGGAAEHGTAADALPAAGAAQLLAHRDHWAAPLSGAPVAGPSPGALKIECGAAPSAWAVAGLEADAAALRQQHGRAPSPGAAHAFMRSNSLPGRSNSPSLGADVYAGFGRSLSAEAAGPLAGPIAVAPPPALVPVAGPAPDPAADAIDPNRGRWDPAVLALSTVELNTYIKRERLGKVEAGELKAYRRKVKNRAYTKRSRVKRALREGRSVKLDPNDRTALWVDALHVTPRRSSKKRAKAAAAPGLAGVAGARPGE